MTYQLFCGDCIEILPTLAGDSVDCVICDPPYPEIDRAYGRMTEADWIDMMQAVVRQSRRILKPTGSAVFILQPNSEKAGKMRLWLWEFMLWAGKEWNIVQDAYWWNFTMFPTAHALRPSLKYLAWLGAPDCYRQQDNVLWSESDANTAERLNGKWSLKYNPSGAHNNRHRASLKSAQRGGTTPFNLLPIANTNSASSAGAHGHGAGTPQALTDWWTRFLCPANGVVADWFCGTGTTGLSAAKYGHSFIGIEKDAEYFKISQARLAQAPRTLFEAT